MSPGSTHQHPKKTDDSYQRGRGDREEKADEGKKMGGDTKQEGAKNPADEFPPLLILNIYWCL